MATAKTRSTSSTLRPLRGASDETMVMTFGLTVGEGR